MTKLYTGTSCYILNISVYTVEVVNFFFAILKSIFDEDCICEAMMVKIIQSSEYYKARSKQKFSAFPILPLSLCQQQLVYLDSDL